MDVSRRTVLLGAAAVGTGGAAVGEAGRSDEGSGGTPSALVAGSLLAVAEAVPGAAVEAHGSATVRRLIRDGARDPDAVALADPRLFAGIEKRVRLFATNALVLAYDPDSPYASALREDWASAVQRPEILLGRSDPERDPLGYRTVLALRLAERRGEVDADAVLDRTRLFPEVQLSNVVDGGGVDAAFVYRNMAVEHDLPYVDLPDRIDFSNPAYAEEYARVSYDLDGRAIPGAPIRYGAAATAEVGEGWVDRLVTGRDRLESHGFVVPDGYPTAAAVPAPGEST